MLRALEQHYANVDIIWQLSGMAKEIEGYEIAKDLSTVHSSIFPTCPYALRMNVHAGCTLR